ncbi:MAG: DUF4386 domain-containing protein [Leptolyngbya sp. SIO1D8]|nr:DUF4386 domain-containing protein [Leptolyngbya sp. SIO1D8]
MWVIFFGFACLDYGYLLYQSDYFPKIIGVLMVIAGLSYLINSFTLILSPTFSDKVFPILLLSFIGELSLALWLTFKGVIVSKWETRMLESNTI